MFAKTIVDGKAVVVEVADEPVIDGHEYIPEPTPEERIAALEAQNEMLTECILELSELLYN